MISLLRITRYHTTAADRDLKASVALNNRIALRYSTAAQFVSCVSTRKKTTTLISKTDNIHEWNLISRLQTQCLRLSSCQMYIFMEHINDIVE